MNIIKSFINLSSKPKELASLPLGEFDLLRSELSPKSSLECIYNNATIILREISQFNYELIIQKMDEELEEIIDDFNDEFGDDTISVLSVQSKIKDKEWTFPINERLNFFKKWNDKGEIVFIWDNIISDEIDEKIQFIIDSKIDLSDIENFKEKIYCCEFSSKFKKNLNTIPDEYLIKREKFSNDLLESFEKRNNKQHYYNEQKNIDIINDNNEENFTNEDIFQDANDGSQLDLKKLPTPFYSN